MSLRVEDTTRKLLTEEEVKEEGLYEDNTDDNGLIRTVSHRDTTDLDSHNVTEVMFGVEHQILGNPTGLYIASYISGESPEKYRHVVRAIEDGSLMSATDLRPDDEILKLNDRVVDQHEHQEVLGLFKTLLSASFQKTQKFSLIIRRRKPEGTEDGFVYIHIDITLSVRVDLLVTESAVGSRQGRTEYGDLNFDPTITGGDSHQEPIRLCLKPKYGHGYIGFDSTNQVQITTSKAKRNRFFRKTFIALEIKGKQPQFRFVVCLQLSKRPNHYLAAQRTTVKLQEYRTPPNPYESLDHPDRYFIIHRIGDFEFYESVAFRGFFVSYTDGSGLSLQAYNWGDDGVRPPDSIFFQREYDTSQDTPDGHKPILSLLGLVLAGVFSPI